IVAAVRCQRNESLSDDIRHDERGCVAVCNRTLVVTTVHIRWRCARQRNSLRVRDSMPLAARRTPRNTIRSTRPLAKFDPKTRAYIDLSAEGPIARQGLRRETSDLFVENVNR